MPWTGDYPVAKLDEKLRQRVLKEQPVCYLQLPGCTVIARLVDHKTPHSKGGTDTRANLGGVCKHCHDLKTQREAQAGRGL